MSGELNPQGSSNAIARPLHDKAVISKKNFACKVFFLARFLRASPCRGDSQVRGPRLAKEAPLPRRQLTTSGEKKPSTRRNKERRLVVTCQSYASDSVIEKHARKRLPHFTPRSSIPPERSALPLEAAAVTSLLRRYSACAPVAPRRPARFAWSRLASPLGLYRAVAFH